MLQMAILVTIRVVATFPQANFLIVTKSRINYEPSVGCVPRRSCLDYLTRSANSKKFTNTQTVKKTTQI